MFILTWNQDHDQKKHYSQVYQRIIKRSRKLLDYVHVSLLPFLCNDLWCWSWGAIVFTTFSFIISQNWALLSFHEQLHSRHGMTIVWVLHSVCSRSSSLKQTLNEGWPSSWDMIHHHFLFFLFEATPLFLFRTRIWRGKSLMPFSLILDFDYFFCRYSSPASPSSHEVRKCCNNSLYISTDNEKRLGIRTCFERDFISVWFLVWIERSWSDDVQHRLFIKTRVVCKRRTGSWGWIMQRSR